MAVRNSRAIAIEDHASAGVTGNARRYLRGVQIDVPTGWVDRGRLNSQTVHVLGWRNDLYNTLREQSAEVFANFYCAHF
ncbi:hypothetical protein ACI2KO_25040 [Pseudomonas piscis]|uniref:hypothetical protein n=1 Tax=Pseudomonas piscis TaxID=2614538 RepID=UPI00384C6646